MSTGGVMNDSTMRRAPYPAAGGAKENILAQDWGARKCSRQVRVRPSGGQLVRHSFHPLFTFVHRHHEFLAHCLGLIKGSWGAIATSFFCRWSAVGVQEMCIIRGPPLEAAVSAMASQQAVAAATWGCCGSGANVSITAKVACQL